jgi:hypothetical protein
MKAGIPLPIALVCLAAFQSSSRAETLLDYIPAGFPINSSPGVPNTKASSFTVGTQPVVVSSVWFRLGAPGSLSSANTTAYIFTDAGGQPGGVVAASPRQFAVGELGVVDTFYEFTFASPVYLTAGTSYWVGFGISPNGELPHYLLARALEDFTPNGITPSLTMASSGYPPLTWSVNAPNQSLAYKVHGTVVPRLFISRQLDGINLVWHSANTNFVLESALAGSINLVWTNGFPEPTRVGNTNLLSLPADAGERFFRLRQPGQ